ncbi:MAG: Gfo/Idh/MocA family oxidoreductase [Planctomycetes bacterium]|nr:Gfo/Idh/MocA family oxidoreductase [Planctomycetota bacterium]MCG2683398.1 Gfo/Idh/MocA family oxidoreductase [Planctomycetales bacterium]
MTKPIDPSATTAKNRRVFLKTSAIAAGAAMTGSPALGRAVHAAGSDVLKVGLVGCGPRGSGAAVNALSADRNARLAAMADLFAENIHASRRNIKKLKSDQVAVDDDHCFTGFDSCRRVIESDVDVVILALPTFFHPMYLKACVDAGKHVFCEKTHAVDAPGVRTVLAAGEVARQKNLSIVSGLAWRYDTGVRETMKRVLDGAIGEIVAVEHTCNTGSLRRRARRSGWTEMRYQLQDWFNFFWLSCDLPGLQLVHSLDRAAWAMREEPPVKCWGMGGRQTRVGPQFGDVWDHHATVFEYARGARVYAYCRQQDGCATDVSDCFHGTKGRCDLLRCRIEGENSWRYEGPDCNRFDLEHVALFSAIRGGTPINNSLYMARSSMLAVMSTWASYTGQEIAWEQAMRSEHVAAPAALSFEAEPPTKPDAHGEYPLPIPGLTKFV